MHRDGGPAFGIGLLVEGDPAADVRDHAEHTDEDGANTSTLLSYCGHTSVASLARYARVSPEASAAGNNNATPPPDADNHPHAL